MYLRGHTDAREVLGAGATGVLPRNSPVTPATAPAERQGSLAMVAEMLRLQGDQGSG